MEKADQFRLYAEEAMCWARQARTDSRREAFVNLAWTWTQAALRASPPDPPEEA